MYTNSINSISITGYTGFQSSITIPSQINGLPVTDLAYDAFANNLTITSVTIPSSVLTIQQGNFYNCPILKSVSVSNTVSYIGPLVFNSCQQLNSITVDSGNTKYSSSNGILFNYDKTLLVAVSSYYSGTFTIPSTVSTISSNAFFGCSSINSIIIPGSVKNINTTPFNYTFNLTSVYFQGDVPTIYTSNLYPDSPNVITYFPVGSAGWVNTFGGKSAVSYSYTKSPTIVTQPTSQTLNTGQLLTLSVSAYGAPALTYQWYYNDSAISGATSSSYIISSATSSNAGSYYVIVTNSAGSVRSSTATMAVLLQGTFIDTQGVVYSYAGSTAVVTDHTGSLSSSVTIPASITVAGTPYTVTSIGSNAFDHAGLSIVSIPSSVTSIGSYAFYYSKLQSVTIPSSVTSITAFAFGYCLSLSSVTIPSSVTSIGPSAFTFCYSLSSVTIPSSVTIIAEYAFNSCTSLSSVTIPNSVTILGVGAFQSCYSLSSVTIPSSVTIIADIAFNSCTSLSSVTFNETVAPIVSNTSFNGIRSGAVGFYPASASYLSVISATLGKISFAPTITSALTASGIYGYAFTYTITGSNGPTNYTATGLPAGLSVNSSTGVISGTPTAAGVTNVTINAINIAGKSLDSTLVITVTPPPVKPAITVQPASTVTINQGSAATLSVTATGTEPTYQWYLGSAAITGATSSNYTITSATSLSAGSYTCVVSNSLGSVTSTAEVVSVIITPVVTSNPKSQQVSSGSTANFTVSATGTSPTYQWYLNGTAIAGATSASYTLTASSGNAGSYTCTITNAAGSVTTSAVQLIILYPGRLTNLSVLSLDGPGTQLLTVGFVTGGSGSAGSQNLLIRGIGPTIGLAPFNVANVLADPAITVFNSSTSIVATNDNWGSSVSNATAVMTADAATGAFALTSTTSLDAALCTNLNAGGYTVQVAGKNGATGNVIAEVYDNTPVNSYTITTPRLVNLSCLEQVSSGGILSTGFVIGGTTSEQVLIRASGPTLGAAPFNLPGTIPDPKLTLFSGSTVLATNTGWGGSAAITAANNATGAFQFNSLNSKDSAVLLTLQPGAYTIQASSASGTAGLTLIEVYEVPAN